MATSVERNTLKQGGNLYLILIAAFAGACLTTPLQCECFPIRSTIIFNDKQSCNTLNLRIHNYGISREGRNSFRGVTTFLKSSENADDNDETEGAAKTLFDLLSPMSSCRVNQMSGTDLAYIGDVVFELFVRSRHVWPSKRTSDLQNTVVGLVRAEHQSYLLSQLKESFPLSEKENQVLMRGRNAVTRSKNRRNPAAYQDSTALEALIGYIYITDPDRCRELLAWLETVVDKREP
jgi:ribonuclease-3 family protein